MKRRSLCSSTGDINLPSTTRGSYGKRLRSALLSPVGPPRFFKTFVLRDFNVELETEVPMA